MAMTGLHAGLGKTALAHVVCHHCGFRPMEINASTQCFEPVFLALCLITGSCLRVHGKQYTKTAMHAGLGKTALAHVVCHHCGFRPVEINASDERSGPALTARVRDAVQMRPVMGSKKPNCVILDEIDGATGGLHYCMVHSGRT